MHANNWLRVFHDSADSDRAMIWFPHGGAPATSGFQISKQLANSVPTMHVQYPGRADRIKERPAETFTELADGIAASLIDGPPQSLVLFGHCMGAIVAFEVARRLADVPHIRIERLIVSGSAAPGLVQRNAKPTNDDEIRSDMHLLGGTDARILAEPDLIDVFFPALRADYDARDRYEYVPGEPLSCPITAIAGADDPLIRLDGCVEEWANYTIADFTQHAFTGGHFYFVEELEPLAALLTTLWQQHFEKAEAP